MEISCDIIRDVLPLYAEDMASPATRDMVDDHLCGCDGCTKELAELLKKPQIPVDVDTSSLKRISHTIRNKKILTVIAALLTVFTVVWSVMLYLTMPYYLTADEAIEGVTLLEDGGLAIDWARGISGWNSYQPSNHDEAFWTLTSRYDWYMGRAEDKKIAAMTEEEIKQYIQEKYDATEQTQENWDRFFNIKKEYCYRNGSGNMMLGDKIYSPNVMMSRYEEGWTLSEPDFDLWYLAEDGSAEKLLWQGSDAMVDITWINDDFSIQYLILFIICAVLMLGCFGAAHFFPEKKWREGTMTVGIISACVLVTHLLVTGGDMIDVLGTRAIHWGQHYKFTVLMLSLTALSWRKLMRMNQNG